MATRPIQVYWDTSVFIELFSDDARSPFLSAIKATLAYARSRPNQFQICTSVLSIAEAAFIYELEYEKNKWVGGHEEKLDRLWNEYPTILLVRCDAGIAREARKLHRWAIERHIKRVQPDDRVHIATARYLKASVIHTLEDAWFPYRDFVSIPIGYPEAPAAQPVPLPFPEA